MEDDEYKTPNQTYYNIAHSSSERVLEQPSLLVGGTLKEYQVSCACVHYAFCHAVIMFHRLLLHDINRLHEVGSLIRL